MAFVVQYNNALGQATQEQIEAESVDFRDGVAALLTDGKLVKAFAIHSVVFILPVAPAEAKSE